MVKLKYRNSSKRLLFLIILAVLILSFFNLILYQRIDAAFKFFSVYYQYLSYEYSISHGLINSSFPITFYHEAFLDLRMSPPRLRLYSLNPCIRKSNHLLVDVFYHGSSRIERMELEGESMEEYCPSMDPLAMPCFYQPYSFSVDVKERGIQKVEVLLGSHKVSLSVKEVPLEREEGLTVCLQPVYYYSQWQNIVLYVEAWRAHGARRFVVFFHSATRETLAVLHHYQSLAILDLRPWPSFGELRRGLGEQYPKVDDSVFIFSYYLAMNICIQEMRTSLGTVADFDEVMVPVNGTLLDYSLAHMKHSNVGALRFESNHVAMSPSIYTNDFEGVGKPNFYDRKAGMPKHVFNTSTIGIAEVHYIKSFIDPFKITKSAEGGLLHFRYAVEKKYPKMKDPGYRFFPDNVEERIENMKATALKIFNGTMPEFNPDLLETMKSCGTDVANQWNQCLTKSGKCKIEMDKMYDWEYDKTEGIFKS